MKTFEDLVRINFMSSVFALAHGVDYLMLQEIRDQAIGTEDYEVAAGIDQAILAHRSRDEDFNCSVKPIRDDDPQFLSLDKAYEEIEDDDIDFGILGSDWHPDDDDPSE